MSLKDEFKKFIHPYDDEDEPVEYQRSAGMRSAAARW